MTMSASPLRGERDVVEAVRTDDAWSLIEEFSTLVRESGTEHEREAVRRSHPVRSGCPPGPCAPASLLSYW